MGFFTNKTKLFGGLLIVLMVATSVPQVAVAQTFQPRTNQELIAYLYGIIAQLQAQQGQFSGGQVLGVSSSGNTSFVTSSFNSFGNYDIDVDTLSARDIDEEEAELRANIDLDGAAFADGWFEYGEDGDLDEETSRVRITNRGDNTRSFTREIDDLDEDELYFFRAVAEGPDGRREYGEVRSFRTDDDRGSSNRRVDDEPEVETGRARDIDENSASLEAEVELNDASSGRLFVVYGSDEDEVEDALREDEISDIDRDGDEINRSGSFNTSRDLDREFDIFGLDEDTRYYYAACVEYRDDGDEELECGDIEDFRTDDD
ncbi:MAG: hypothetical protein AAGA35_03110 [Patescibacteria group bacterium]